MTIREELASLYKRFDDPARVCDECGALPVAGKRDQFIIVKVRLARLIYLVCEECADGDLPNIAARLKISGNTLFRRPQPRRCDLLQKGWCSDDYALPGNGPIHCGQKP
jgi:hypothetical protein